MTHEDPSTEFATAERASEKEIYREAGMLSALNLMIDILDAIPDIVFILNHYRQIVFANLTCIDIFKVIDRQEIYGLRPGEALKCTNALETKSGCGTRNPCRTCGAVSAIQFGLGGKRVTKECRILQEATGKAFDLRVTATPLRAYENPYVIFVANDISHEKRRNILERAFFHDISNTLTNVICFAELLTLSPDSESRDLLQKLNFNINIMEDEIVSQKN